ncbi:MAG: energy transducer TonB [Alistipes sp.]|jgi:TonB family protein|nr:energy transducer TonB [Alistipes sp.]
MDNKRQRLDLPFTRRRRDVPTRIYDHRVGIFALLALTLAMGILFVGSKITVRTPEPDDAILVDLRTVEELRQEAARLAREVMMRQMAEGGAVRNAFSNEGAELSDDRNTDMSSVRGAADDAAGLVSGNRDAWNRAMAEIDAMGTERPSGGQGSTSADSRAKGRVMVSFSFANPVRYSDYLVTPGYRCERGGEVIVVVTLNRNGDVVSASVDRGSSTNDACMHDTALDAARRSRFNIDGGAPERHTGTITYTFIPQ